MKRRQPLMERICVTRGAGVLANLLTLLVVCVGLAPQMSPACPVPVFRYALERWPAAPYQLIVVSEGPLDKPGQELLSRLSAKAPDDPVANLTARILNPRATPLDGFPGGLDLSSFGGQPALVLQYPDDATHRGAVWSAPFTESNLRQLLDSPFRRRIVQRLVQGDSAVWVLLESGDTEQDNAAARLLQTQLERNQRTIALPNPESGGNPEDSTVTNELNVAFSLLRLARNDPAEELFIRLLLGSEDDLNETRDPMAFPIYGRGRILYTLVGKGINPETIDEACAFLTGPCSCVIKDLNPGLDLLLSADWDGLIRPVWTSSDELSELTGRRTRLADQNSTASFSAGELPRASANPTLRVFKHSLILAGSLSALVLLIGCQILLRKRD